MSTTTEERLARLEALFETQGEDIKEIKGDVRDLVQAMQTGRGALWLLLKIGAAILGILAVAKLGFDMVKH
jgi:hypothetical protein